MVIIQVALLLFDNLRHLEYIIQILNNVLGQSIPIISRGEIIGNNFIEVKLLGYTAIQRKLLLNRVIATTQCCCYKCVTIICVSETVFSIKYHHVLFKIVLYMVCRGYVYGMQTDLGGNLQNNCYSLEISSVLGPKSDYYWQIL